jgi:transcriptional regulator with XRE-family HTH domain
MNKTDVRELRDSTGLTQAAFAKMFDIPVSTLRKWEQYEAAPPKYVVKLIARTLPAADERLECIKGRDGERYYFDPAGSVVMDRLGTRIVVSDDLEGVKRQNLALYLKDLFEAYYDARDKFERDCRFDRQEDIIWS